MPWNHPWSGPPAPHALPEVWQGAARYWLAAAETAFYSAVTINARLQQIGLAVATGGSLPHAEIWRMTSEKPLAAMQSLLAASRANAALATDPRSLTRAATAGLGPYRRTTRSNARRLNR